MKKILTAFVAALSLSVLGLTGCGGGGENKVIESSGQEGATMTQDQQSQYEEMMKSGYGTQQGPQGN